jgi:glutaredoxin
MRTALLSVLAGVLVVLFAAAAVQRVRTDGSVLPGWVVPPVQPPAAAVEPPPVPVEEPAPAPEPPPLITAGELSVLDDDAPIPLFRYVDAGGSVRMARGLANVPPEHRASATPLERAHVNLVNVPMPAEVAVQDWQPEFNPNRVDVVMFGARWCGACARARKYFEERGIAYEERDIDADSRAREELLRIVGRIAVPLVQVNGRSISGFRREVYDRLLR